MNMDIDEPMNDLFGENQEDPDDMHAVHSEAEEDAENVNPLPNDKTAEAIKPKKVVRNPMPKLDAQRLMGPRGIGILPGIFKDVKFKGKGYEKQDLNLLLKKMEHWAHRLYPKLNFDDMVESLEKLGTKKPVHTLLKRIRMDMFEQGDPEEDIVKRGTDDEVREPEVDVFDNILGQQNTQSQNTSTLTDEQLERMERNKQLAMERLKAKKNNEASQNTEIPTDQELEVLFSQNEEMDV